MPKAQSAVEFILLITALLFISIPIFYLLTDYGITSSSDISQTQLQQIGKRIVDESREVYYLGRFSKEIITVNMPEAVNSMGTLIIEDNDEYYLVINYTRRADRIDLAIPSEVPLITGDCSDATSCYSGNTCYYCSFDAVDYRAGIKNFKLETIASWNGMTAVNISQVTW
jgi:hypothetical protein